MTMNFVKGMDLSTLAELEKCGAKYYDNGEEKDILEIMKSYDVDGKKYSLSSFGIKTGGYFTTSDNSKSALHIDGDEDDELTSGNTDKLRAARASDPETFISFFTQLSKGIYNELDKKMKGTTLSSAYTVYNDKSMQTEYRNYTKKISEWEDLSLIHI